MLNNMQQFDYLIIGAGPGGYETAAAAAANGASVALVERDKLGGTCLNCGCIPTKAMAHAADILREAREGALYGINAEPNVDFARLCQRREEVVGQLREGIEALMGRVTVIRGEARFVGAKEVEIEVADAEAIRATADKIIIATGSAPAALPIPGAENAMSSDQLLAMTELPESMVIIGGGVIGMEFASIFATLGVKVTVVEYCKEILPQFDKDIAKRLRTQLAAAGIDFLLGAAVTAIEPGRVVYELKGKQESVEAEKIVMAVGRRPVLPEGLDLAGVELDRKAIRVDRTTMETSSSGVYAIGDVNAICMLAHAASAQGRRVLGEEVNLDVIPSVVFTHPELAMVGASEQQLKDAEVEYKSVKSLFRGNGKAVSMNETSGMVKLLYSPADGQILGCAIMGPHAADMIEEVAVAMTNCLPVAAIAQTIHPHPTLCEALLTAAMQVR